VGVACILTGITEIIYSDISMITRHDPLSPDLEWMLQSDQVDDEALIQHLVHSYFVPIYQKALSQLIYPEEAQRVAQETLVQAVLRSSSYRGSIPVDAWLDDIYSPICAERQAVLQAQELHNPQLIDSINSRVENDTLSSRQIQLATQAIHAEVTARRLTRSRNITAQVLGIVGILAVMALILIRNWDTWIPVPGSVTAPPTQATPAGGEPGVNVTRQEELDQPPGTGAIAALDLNSSSDEIRQRILESRRYWDTMWAKLLVTFHGPQSYLGPPIQEWHQFWIDPQHGGMLVSGPKNEFPDYVERFDIPGGMDIGDRATYGSAYALIGSQLPWFTLNLETILGIPYVLNYLSEASITEDLSSVTYTPVGMDVWAGHQALIVDLKSEGGVPIGRQTLEPVTGIILREQYYALGTVGKRYIESSLEELAFNQGMPNLWKRSNQIRYSPRLYMPEFGYSDEDTYTWSGNLTDHNLSGAVPPSNFDPAEASLVFLKSSRLADQGADSGIFEIYAGSFHLGEIEISDPQRMICTRSRDGERIAMAEWTLDAEENEREIYWFDLDSMHLNRLEPPGMVLHWIGFSPDGSQLGLSGYSEREGKNQFALLDLETGEYHELPIPASFNRITWSPDGSQIAVLEEAGSSFDADSERKINLYSAIDGKLEEQFTVEGELPDVRHISIPLDGWSAEFDLLIQDLSTCAIPPGI